MSDFMANARIEVRPVPTNRAFWILWVLAGLVGYAAGGPLGVASGAPGNIIENAYMTVTFSAVIAAVLQFLILRRRLTHTAWWIPSVAIGAIASAAVIFPGQHIHSDIAWVVGASLLQPAAAFFQWRLILRRHISRGAFWWVPVCLVSWLAGALSSAPVNAALGSIGVQEGLVAAVTWAVVGTVYGALTGGVLVWLLRRRAESAVEEAGLSA